MGSIAMDKSGNMRLGYSVSSSATLPSIRYTGWEVGNPLGTLQMETQMVGGSGSQTGYNRWGDYSVMLTDPSDDCTFWYTTEYQAVTADANWSTRIGSFHFPSCGQTLRPTTTTLGSSQNPSSVAVGNIHGNGCVRVGYARRQCRVQGWQYNARDGCAE